MTPTSLRSGEFEKALLDGAARTPGVLMSRYGVTATLQDGKWTPIESLPDFEGVWAGGRQFIIEAKVCSQSNFPLEKKAIKPRQVKHMLERSAAGVPCWVMIHFNERRLVRIHQPAETLAIPVHAGLPFWREFVDAYAEARRNGDGKVAPQGSLSRERAARIGIRIEWTAPGRSRKPLPDLGALLGVNDD